MSLTNRGQSKPLGGYFELELPNNGEFLHQGAFTYQSARAAFRALLQAKRPARVWMPKYICDAMLTPLLEEGVEHLWYDLDDGLNAPDSITLKDDELLLYVNYYGVCQEQVDSLIRRYPAKQVVYDYSQSLFDLPRTDALATIYSVRKFFGVPDGGMLITDVPIMPPVAHDVDSLQRMTHLLKRLYAAPELGYADYLASEDSLVDSTPKKMSGLTRRLLQSVDCRRAKKKRLENFNFLHSRLKGLNRFIFDGRNIVAPLCYPFMTENNSLREELIKNRIFVPTYWNDALVRVDEKWADTHIHRLLPIPLDHRYGKRDLDNIASMLISFEDV